MPLFNLFNSIFLPPTNFTAIQVVSLWLMFTDQKLVRKFKAIVLQAAGDHTNITSAPHPPLYSKKLKAAGSV